MPTIKPYTEQYGTPTADFSGRRASPEDAGGYAAAGLGVLGKGIGALAQDLTRIQEDQDLTMAQMLVQRASAEVSSVDAEIKKAATPGGSTAIQINQYMDDSFRNMGSELKTKKGRDYFNFHTSNIRNKATQGAATFDIKLAVQDKLGKQKDAIKAAGQTIFADPSSYVEQRNTLLADIKGDIGIWSMPGDALSRMKIKQENEAQVQQLAWMAAQGSINNQSMRGMLAGNTTPGYSTASAMSVSEVMPRLLMAESGGKHIDPATGKMTTNAKSGAYGIGQVMPATAKDPGYGVKPLQNDSEEEHIRFSTDLLTAYKKALGGDMVAAVAAYNHGIGNVKRAMADGGDWMSKLPKETKNYTAKILGVSSTGDVGGVIDPKAMPEWYDDLTPQQKVQFGNQLHSTMQREKSVANAALKRTVQDHMAYVNKHHMPPEDKLNRNAFPDEHSWQSYNSAMVAAERMKQYGNMPIDAIVRDLNQSEPKRDDYSEPGAYSMAVASHDSLKKMVGNLSSAREDDPVAVAYSGGFSTDSPIKPIDETAIRDVQSLVGFLKEREPQAMAVYDAWGGKYYVLMKSEAQAIRQSLDSMSIQDQTKFIISLQEGITPESYRSVLSQIYNDDSAPFAVGSINSGFSKVNNGKTAEEVTSTIMYGYNVISGKDIDKETQKVVSSAIPSDSDVAKLLRTYLGNAEISQADVGRLATATKAYWVGNKLREDGGGADLSLGASSPSNRRKFNEAVKDILPIANINGTNVLLPFGMELDEFKRRVNHYASANNITAPVVVNDGGSRYRLFVGSMPTNVVFDALDDLPSGQLSSGVIR